MAKKHPILFLAVVLSCDIFIDSEAASALDVNIKVDVNGKTVIDESYTEGKFVIYGLLILCRGICLYIYICMYIPWGNINLFGLLSIHFPLYIAHIFEVYK